MVGTRSSQQALTPGLKTDRKSLATPSRRRPTGWYHAPTTLTLLWLAVSLPLVAWDTGYVLGRPATMPGGWLHAPFWTPYALYGEVDHMYGKKQWDAGNGFTAAQGTLNVVESLMYLVYLGIWWANGKGELKGKAAGWAVLFGWAGAVMTLSKTVLYWLNEAFSGFDNIGHNSLGDLVLLWIIPKYVSSFPSMFSLSVFSFVSY